MLYLKDLHYEYPKELVASQPVARGASRILSVYRNYPKFEEISWDRLAALFSKGDVLVFNNSRVLPARVLFKKESGAEAEFLFLGFEQNSYRHWSAMTRNLNLKEGKIIQLPGGLEVKALKTGLIASFEVLNLEFKPTDVISFFEKHGSTPLPPYIMALRKNEVTPEDMERYQNVWAEHWGSVAAPTAGLHFSKEFLNRLREKGVNIKFITLHVGAGTFLPIQTEKIDDFKIHSEPVLVDAEVCQAILNAKAKGKKVWACGTTTVRALETAALQGKRIGTLQMIQPYKGHTDLMIQPGFQFQVIDGLLTNFHLPESSLLLLVSAFASSDRASDRSQSLKHVGKLMDAYKFAMEKKFRLFSYGDLMVIYP